MNFPDSFPSEIINSMSLKEMKVKYKKTPTNLVTESCARS